MQSHVQYCCTTWASWKTKGNQAILQRLQAVCNKYFRLIYNLDRTESVRCILKNDNILTVNQLYDYNISQIMYKAKLNELPVPLQRNFNIGIIRPCLFSVNKTRILQTQKSIYQAGPRVWNTLPHNITIESNATTFKASLKKHILGKSN